MKNAFTIVICFALSHSIAYSQPSQIENLVFEGAGIRGIAYAGVMEGLEEEELLRHVQKVGGTSAGAITSLLISLGYTSTELVGIISEMKFQKLNDGRFFFIGGLVRTKNQFGWYRDTALSEWIGGLIAAKTGDSEITFAQLKESGYKELYVTATSLTRQKLVVLSHETFPQMKVKDAVRISMSIPLYFQAVFVDQDGNTFDKQNEEATLDVMVDGGIVGNFPIFIFDSLTTDSSGAEVRIVNGKTLGIRMDTEEQIEKDREDRELVNIKIESFEDYATAFYTFVIENLNRKDLTKEDWERTVSVSCAGISPRVKKLSNAQKQKLITSGRSAVEKFLVESE